jgi:hypothetical protein
MRSTGSRSKRWIRGIRHRGLGLMAASLAAWAIVAAPGSPSAAPRPQVDIDRIPAADRLGHLEFDDGTTKAITPEDVLWAARMIHGETGGRPDESDAAAMLWAIAQRTRWSPTWRRRSLSDLIQRYSQPINVKWSRDGVYCRKYDGADQSAVPDQCSESRLRRRDVYRTVPWGEIHPTARRMVLEFADGRVPNPVAGAVGWFGKGMWTRREKAGENEREQMVMEAEIERNVFFRSTKPDTRGWRGAEVVVAGLDGTRSSVGR